MHRCDEPRGIAVLAPPVRHARGIGSLDQSLDPGAARFAVGCVPLGTQPTGGCYFFLLFFLALTFFAALLALAVA